MTMQRLMQRITGRVPAADIEHLAPWQRRKLARLAGGYIRLIWAGAQEDELQAYFRQAQVKATKAGMDLDSAHLLQTDQAALAA